MTLKSSGGSIAFLSLLLLYLQKLVTKFQLNWHWRSWKKVLVLYIHIDFGFGSTLGPIYVFHSYFLFCISIPEERSAPQFLSGALVSELYLSQRWWSNSRFGEACLRWSSEVSKFLEALEKKAIYVEKSDRSQIRRTEIRFPTVHIILSSLWYQVLFDYTADRSAVGAIAGCRLHADPRYLIWPRSGLPFLCDRWNGTRFFLGE